MSKLGTYVPYDDINTVGAVVLFTDVIKIILRTGLFRIEEFVFSDLLVVAMMPWDGACCVPVDGNRLSKSIFQTSWVVVVKAVHLVKLLSSWW